MNAITRWDPVKEMEELHNRLSNLFGRKPARLGDGKEESITVAEWAPLVDITEDDKEYIVKTESLEVKKEDVKVSFENGLLTVAWRTEVRERGERKVSSR